MKLVKNPCDVQTCCNARLCVQGSPGSTLSFIFRSSVAMAGRLQQGRKKRERTKKGGTRQEEHGQEGWEQQSKTNPVEEPPLQSDEHRCLAPSFSSSSFSSSCLHLCFFPPPFSLLLHYSSACGESPALGSGFCCCCRISLLPSSFLGRPSFLPPSPGHGDSEPALSCR